MDYNKIEDIPLEESIDLIMTNFIPDIHEYKELEKNSGAHNNIVTRKNNNNNKKIVFRKTKNPLNTIPFNVLENFKNYLKKHDLPENTSEVETFVNTNYILQESNIWYLAHEHNISPYLYYYGIYRKTEFKQKNPTASIMAKMLPAEPYHSIYQVVISEGYDMNISDYYNKPKNDGYNDRQSIKLSDTDKMIANQLMNLLDKLHSKIKVICFDIKPENCVINLDPFDVKLIDFDSDWCQYNQILKKRGTDEQKQLIKFLSIMTLANHFLYYCNWNIFSDYLLDNKDKLNMLKPSLLILFCDLNNEYEKISEHYLYYDRLNRKNIFGHPRQKPNTCEGLFNEMFEDMFKLKDRNNYTTCNTSKKRSRSISTLSNFISPLSRSISPLSKKKKGGTRKKKRKGGGTCTSKPIATPLSHGTPMLIDTPDKQALAFLICKRADAEVLGPYYPNSVAYRKTKSKKKKSIRKGGTKKKKNFRFKNDDIDSEMRGILEPNSIINFYKNTEPKSISMYNLLEEGKLDKSLKEKLTKKPVSKPKSILKKGGQNPDESGGCTTDEEYSGLNLNDISGIEPDPNDPNNSSLFSDYGFNDSVDNSTNSFNLNDSNSPNNSDNVFNHPIYNMVFNDSIDNTRLTDYEESY